MKILTQNVLVSACNLLILFFFEKIRIKIYRIIWLFRNKKVNEEGFFFFFFDFSGFVSPRGKKEKVLAWGPGTYWRSIERIITTPLQLTIFFLNPGSNNEELEEAKSLNGVLALHKLLHASLYSTNPTSGNILLLANLSFKPLAFIKMLFSEPLFGCWENVRELFNV